MSQLTPVSKMFVGMPPFTGDTAEELFAAVLNSDETLSFPPEADVSEVAQHLVRSFLTHVKEHLFSDSSNPVLLAQREVGIKWCLGDTKTQVLC